MALSKIGNFDDAKMAHYYYLVENSHNPYAWYNIGNTFYGSGDFANASLCFWAATTLKPDFSDAWNNYGVVLSKQGQYPEAIAAFTNATSSNPNLTAAYYNKGNVLFEIGNYSEAIVEYDRALQLNPDDPTIKQKRDLAIGKTYKVPFGASYVYYGLGLIFVMIFLYLVRKAM
jgi:tetratricopeptide (TPR) repeat protein